MMKKLLAFILTMSLLCASALADSPMLEDKGLDLGASSVHYPQLTGLEDEHIQQSVNNAILAAADIENQVGRMALLMSAPVGLTISYTAMLEGDVLSCVLQSSGAVTFSGTSHVWHTVNIDLRTGLPVTFADLFTDEAAGLAAIEEYLLWEVAPELSAHLANSELTPLPEAFSLSPTGLTLYYPAKQLSTLSDRAGAVTIHWYEISDCLNLEAGSILARIGVPAMLTPDTDSAQQIRTAVENGSLPGIPVRLDAPLQAATDTYRMLVDPDLYEGGRMFQLEDAAFRGAWLLTDALTEDWDASVIQGIRTDRANFFGLVTGVTTVDGWRSLLGEPDASVVLDADRADAYWLVPGTSDYYRIGAYQLRLHADENGVLTSIFLMK